MQFLLVTKKNHFICRQRWSITHSRQGCWLAERYSNEINKMRVAFHCVSVSGLSVLSSTEQRRNLSQTGKTKSRGHPRLIPGPIKNRQTQLTEKSNEDMKAHRFRTTTHDIWELDNYYTKSSIIIIFICACM